MKKTIKLIFLIMFLGCTASKSILLNENDLINFNKTKEELIYIAKNNQNQDIDKFFEKGLKNDIILKELKKINSSDFVIIIPENEIRVLSNGNLKTLVVITYQTNTMYYTVYWKKYGDTWKISNIEEQN